jgi:60 kDa SS-A/Ro ribonucleoprotein
VSNWYLNKDAKSVAYQVTKYANRNGWTHRDVLRLCHAKTDNAELNDVFKYVCQNEKWQSSELETETNDFLAACQEAKHCDVTRALFLINEYGLAREHLNTEHLNSVAIWETLLKGMPSIALLRNLGKMGSIGLLKPLSSGSKLVLEKLENLDAHPLAVLLAYATYKQGCGVLGKNTWQVDQNIVAGLDGAFYKAFSNVIPSKKRFYLGIDCSGSMNCGSIAGSPVTPVMGAGVMAMATIKTEPFTYNAGFNHNMVEIGLNRADSLDVCVNKILRTPWGRTDCALPMVDALQKRLEVDCFVCYTDNETFFDSPHPFQALKQYRQQMGIDAKLIVVGMTATQFTIADPSDAGMLDVVGFDTTVPSVISDFVR